MPLYDADRLKPISDTARIGTHALDDRLLQLALDYKRNVAKRYRLINGDDIRRYLHDKVYCSIKVDGHFSYLYRDAQDIFIFNYSGRVITGLPLLADAEQRLSRFDRVICACELYCPDQQGRSRVYDVTQALGSGGSALDNLRLAVYDLIEVNGERLTGRYYEEIDKMLVEALPASGPCHRCETHLVEGDEVLRLYREWVVRGQQEGIIARNAEHTVYKIKPRHSLDAVVIGFTERPDTAGTISALLTALMRPDGSYQVLATVGTGLSESLRQELFTLLKPLERPSVYKEADGNHSLFTMVEPVVIIELQFIDLLTEHASGRPLTKAVLTFAEDGYDARMPEPFVALIAPIFAGVRDDKQVTPTDLRLTQLQPYVDLDNLEKPARAQAMTESELIQRRVYVKTTKELKSVRKFLAWKTNKNEVEPAFPGYVFCYVDYSPGRKAPLKRMVKVTNSRAQLEQLFKQALAAEVKRGWELVAES